MNRGGRFQFLVAAVAALGSIALSASALAASKAFMFAGQRIAPGETVRADVPLTDLQRKFATEGGNTPPAQAVAVLAVPPGFDPRKPWPVLIVFSTDDFKRLDRDDLAQFYRADALAEGWVILAGDGPEFPRPGTPSWRAGMTLAALDALYRSFPGSSKWPVACAGYSGGAKQSGYLAPLLSLAGCRIIGLYLTGINFDQLSRGYQTLRPGRNFLRTPVFISFGASDRIAPPHSQMAVKLSAEKTGFERVRLETFAGGHRVEHSHVRAALRWFRALAAAP